MNSMAVEEKKPVLLLKWGTVKGWRNIPDGECRDLLERYLDDLPMSCAMDKPDQARKELLCELIQKLDGTIWNDWDGREMTKEEATSYVVGYGQ